MLQSRENFGDYNCLYTFPTMISLFKKKTIPFFFLNLNKFVVRKIYVLDFDQSKVLASSAEIDS